MLPNVQMYYRNINKSVYYIRKRQKIKKFLSRKNNKKNLPLQDRQEKHVSCIALVKKVLRYRLAKVLTSYCTRASRNAAKCSR